MRYLCGVSMTVYFFLSCSDGSSLSSFSAGSGLLHTILSLLLTSPTTLELGAQQWLNSLAGNLFCGVAVANMHPIESPPPGVRLEPTPYTNQLWSMFKDKQVTLSFLSSLLVMVLECLLLNSLCFFLFVLSLD